MARGVLEKRMARGSTATRGNPSSSAVARDESVVGRGARVRGRVSGDGSLRVEGQVEGEIAVSGDLSIDEGAVITGDVEAHAVTISGALTGDVSARGPVAIRATAKVAGNMGGAEVSLEEGASFTGRIEADFELPPELLATPGGR
jgi:cytoskeletal protein CcmA (bactofilin family)